MNDFDQTYLDTAERREDDPTATGRLGVSPAVIKRLPRYYRYLRELIRQDKLRISSSELSRMMNVTASQIRQDFNCFGGFGQQGYGYNVSELRNEIGAILGVDRQNKAILIGAGNLGHAIAVHLNFDKYGCKLCGIFDTDPKLVGSEMSGMKIMGTDRITEFCRQNQPKIAILCIPKSAAPQICELLISLGVTAFWNFSHYDINLEHNDLIVENVHLGDSLLALNYAVSNSGNNE